MVDESVDKRRGWSYKAVPAARRAARPGSSGGPTGSGRTARIPSVLENWIVCLRSDVGPPRRLTAAAAMRRVEGAASTTSHFEVTSNRPGLSRRVGDRIQLESL